MTISVEHSLLTSESAHQHQQRGLRQVEVGEQCTDYAEFISRVDKDIGLTASCRDSTRFRGGIFECPDRGCAYRYNSSSSIKDAIDGGRGFAGNGIGLAMQLVVFDALLAYGLKCPQTDVEGDFRSPDAAFL